MRTGRGSRHPKRYTEIRRCIVHTIIVVCIKSYPAGFCRIGQTDLERQGREFTYLLPRHSNYIEYYTGSDSVYVSNIYREDVYRIVYIIRKYRKTYARVYLKIFIINIVSLSINKPGFFEKKITATKKVAQYANSGLHIKPKLIHHSLLIKRGTQKVFLFSYYKKIIEP